MIQFQVYMLKQTLVIIQMLIDSLSYIAIIINNHRISISKTKSEAHWVTP